MRRTGYTSDNGLFWILGDHLGSTSVTANSNGSFKSKLLYKAWGEIRYSSGAVNTKYTFTGQYTHVDDFGLLFYVARWYDPTLGRFAQADTMTPGGVQGLDRYAAMNNNPVRFTDPTGQDVCDEYYNCYGRQGTYQGARSNSSSYNYELDTNKDGDISEQEAEAYFVKNLLDPGEGLHSNRHFGGPCTTTPCSGYHAGVDFSSDNKSVTAAASGKVVDVDSDPKGAFGEKVVIQTDVYGYSFYSIYGHLSSTAGISEGDTINAGDSVGTMGHTPFTPEENVPDHLHFEVRKAANVNLDEYGNYVSLPQSAASFWALSSEDLHQKFVDLGPRFGYWSDYPW